MARRGRFSGWCRRNDGGVKLACIGAIALWSAAVLAGQVQVRHSEGIVHGFLALRAPDGALIANGDLIQLAQGGRVTSRLVFRFKDGSLRDETSVYTQRGAFRLVSNHLVQKGPSFPQPIAQDSGNRPMYPGTPGSAPRLRRRLMIAGSATNSVA